MQPKVCHIAWCPSPMMHAIDITNSGHEVLVCCRDEAREMFFFGFDNYLKHGHPKVWSIPSMRPLRVPSFGELNLRMFSKQPGRGLSSPVTCLLLPSVGNDLEQISSRKLPRQSKYLWAQDEVRPISCRGHDSQGGIAITLIDSLDTLLVTHPPFSICSHV